MRHMSVERAQQLRDTDGYAIRRRADQLGPKHRQERLIQKGNGHFLFTPGMEIAKLKF
jgi:hypothetical protein